MVRWKGKEFGYPLVSRNPQFFGIDERILIVWFNSEERKVRLHKFLNSEVSTGNTDDTDKTD